MSRFGVFSIVIICLFFFIVANASEPTLTEPTPQFDRMLRALAHEREIALHESSFKKNENSLSFNPKSYPYVRSDASDYSRLAAAAYCAPVSYHTGSNKLEQWSCGACKASNRHLKYVSYFHVEASDVNGYVGYDTAHKTIYLVFTGTQSVTNWLYNIDAIFVNFNGNGVPANAKVHAGFYSAWTKSRDEVLAKLDQVLAKVEAGSRQIRVIGHSLGGAIAVHAALDLALGAKISVHNVGGMQIVKTGSIYDVETPFDEQLSSTLDAGRSFSMKWPVYTYGQPRVGNEEWINFAGTKMGAVWRVVHYKDIVPHLPPLSVSSGRHVTTEVFYDQDFALSSERICSYSDGEDPACSNQFSLPSSVADHLEYFSYHLGSPADPNDC